jgi:hypothetical protein
VRFHRQSVALLIFVPQKFPDPPMKAIQFWEEQRAAIVHCHSNLHKDLGWSSDSEGSDDEVEEVWEDGDDETCMA